MPIERTIIFCGGRGYLINATMAALSAAPCFDDDVDRQAWILSGLSKLSDLKWDMYIDMDDFICCPNTGMELPIELWLIQYAIEDDSVSFAETWPGPDEDSVGTWGIDDEMEDIDLESEQEEAITAEEEEELVMWGNILMELSDEYDHLEDDDEYIS